MVRMLFVAIAVFLVALVAGIVGAFPVFVLGLFVPGYVVLPLTVLLAGLFSALGAAWTANFLQPDRSTGRTAGHRAPTYSIRSESDLLRIVVVVEVVGLLLVVAFWVLTFVLMVTWPFPASPLLLVVLVFAAASTASAQRFRHPEGSLARTAWLTLGLIVGAVLVVFLAVFATCSLTPCIP